MKFSAQEEYGLRCMIQLARGGERASLTISEISEKEGISLTHAAKLLMVLRKAGYIQSTRGQAGGYTLSRPASQILVGELLAALGGRLYDQEFCRKHTGRLDICCHEVDCSVRSLWQVIQQSVDSVLDQLTLADMIAPQAPSTSPITLTDPRQRKLTVLKTVLQ